MNIQILCLIITTYSNVSIEKNEVITISPYQMNYQAENLYVHFPPGITINILLENTRNEMGNSFLTYSAVVDCFVNKMFLSLDNPFDCNRERTKF